MGQAHFETITISRVYSNEYYIKLVNIDNSPPTHIVLSRWEVTLLLEGLTVASRSASRNELIYYPRESTSQRVPFDPV